jgi:hypothetical protein
VRVVKVIQKAANNDLIGAFCFVGLEKVSFFLPAVADFGYMLHEVENVFVYNPNREVLQKNVDVVTICFGPICNVLCVNIRRFFFVLYVHFTLQFDQLVKPPFATF